ncbi:hypoxanthine phosphoribosyltransferase [Candidatus Sumerlaeota bacterium]|nr:hypoxanthine phosphoribosyltransferase [Candidatus Sumerlaeota bacterium]
MEDHLQRVLFTPEQIAQRVAEIGAEVSHEYAGRDLTLVSILKGGVVFLADLTRTITIPHAYDMVGAASYGASVTSSGQVTITKDVDVNLMGRDVLVIEDIYDTGHTLKVICDLLRLHNPRSLEICAMLVKDKARDHDLSIRFCGFHIPDEFVVGYGLDHNELYRDLPCIGVLKPEIYQRG